ncbi:MAG: DUF2950 domain-containing protein [Planctomycetota bacterium]
MSGRSWSFILAAICISPLAACAQQQRVFDSPEQAARTLVTAAAANDETTLRDIFGADAWGRMNTDDDVAEKADRAGFAEWAEAFMRLDEEDDGSMTMVVGRDRWPFPFPLVKTDAGWHFDAEAGVDEMISRRIGRNELNAIEMCREYVVAQHEYARDDHDGDEVLEFAQRITSSPGKRDGLFWETGPDEPLSPLGPLAAEAEKYLDGDPRTPFLGYHFRILKRQGKNPPGGAYDYVINGNMIAGFALIAYPSDYGDGGVMTFLVSHNGQVFEKDLGDKTTELARAIDTHDPDDTWTVTASVPPRWP